MKVTIAGGGIIGLCCTYFLSREGYQVEVIDKGDFNTNCSQGNAGLVTPSHFLPLAEPGIVTHGIHWLLKKSSPFYIKPRLSLDLLLWMIHFFKSANQDHVERSIPFLRDISYLSKSLFEQIVEDTGINCEYKNSGLVNIYKTAEIEKHELETANLANIYGVEAQILSQTDLEKMDSGIKYDVRGAVFYPDDANLNPSKFIMGLKKHLAESGVIFIDHTQIMKINADNERIKSIQIKNEIKPVEYLVIAMGNYSADFLKKAGIKLKMQEGKGYSFDVKNKSNMPGLAALLLEGRVALTPFAGMTRLAGSMEISGMDSTIHMHRVNAIADTFRQFYPEINLEPINEKDVWYGYRPLSHDGLPYIGKTSHFENLVIATGHSMMGFSLGPATGKLVSEMVENTRLSMDISAFHPLR